ncbi:MAG: hypothetical protein DSZ23_01940 [Thermodesulfatator sp.]|nr:MAG: hypothetical protein DSZ23_01940 [Thermodesulfatator sp.]
MKDNRGLYYYPVLENKNLRMYVRVNKDEIEFRLWDQNDKSLWDEHGWIPWTAINQAAEIYEKEGRKGKPPTHLYDIEVAIRIIRDYVQQQGDSA